MPQPNINKMLKQVQQMQADMMKAQEQLKDEEVEASAGGGMVTVKMSGDREVKEVRIDASALGDDISPEDLEMLQDTLVAAINEASRSAEELASRKLGGLTGGLGGLGDLGLPGL
jgi:nucleoid-associated protein EbfC